MTIYIFLEKNLKLNIYLKNNNLRLNLFRNKIEKPTVFDVLVAESKQTNNFSIKRSKSLSDAEKIKRQIHELAEEKLRQESGDVKFFSYKKKIQFQFRIKKVEKNLEEKQKEKKEKKERKEKNNSRSEKNIVNMINIFFF